MKIKSDKRCGLPVRDTRGEVHPCAHGAEWTYNGRDMCTHHFKTDLFNDYVHEHPECVRLSKIDIGGRIYSVNSNQIASIVKLLTEGEA